MAHPNADLFRKGFEAMVAGDMARMGDMIADDAKWHWPGTSRVSGDFEGKEAILAMFAEPMPEGMTWQSELHAVLAMMNTRSRSSRTPWSGTARRSRTTWCRSSTSRTAR